MIKRKLVMWSSFFTVLKKKKKQKQNLKKKLKKSFLEWNFLKFFHKKFLEKTDFF